MTTPEHRLTAALADRYRIERALGAGGMATVYLAHDLRHDRDVAIKVLHPDLGAALGAERFLAEIKTTAKLQHPHILPLLDSGAADGLLFYVMPYVRGETLRARLERERQLAIDVAVQIAAEVGDALAAAHALGIIHRDIKPENILLQDGHALVADFGIALALQQAGGQRMTQTGLSLGTPQYMSPEQAVGEKSVDARSDLYALAAVTYEMLTGDPPFQGHNVQAIIARIVSSEPEPVATLRKTAPMSVSAAVMKSLAKLPADRHADVRQFVAALRGDSTATRASGARVAPTWRALGWSWGVAGVLGAIAVAGWLSRGGSLPATNAVALSVELPEGTSTDNVGQSIALSPDGQTVVVVGAATDGSRRLYVRRLAETGVQPLAGTEDATFAVISSDGEWVAFVAGARLKKVPLAGGAVRELADVGACYGITWMKSGDLVVSSGGRLVRVSADGGPLTLLPTVGTDKRRTERFPVALPDGQSILYVEWIGGIRSARVRYRRLDEAKAAPFGIDSIVPLGVNTNGVVAALPGGRVGFIPTGADFAHATGAAVVVLAGATDWISVAQASSARSGALAYQPGSAQADLVFFDPERKTATVISDERRAYASPRLSPDGRRIASEVASMASSDLWITDVASRATTRLTRTLLDSRAEWTPDGTRLTSQSQDGRNSTIKIQRWDGTGTASVLQAYDTATVRQAVFSPDGRHLLFRTGTANTADIFWRNVDGDTTAHVFTSTPGADLSPRWSPDGTRVAWDSDVSGTAQVYVAAFPSGERRLQVSDNGGEQAIWSRDGRAIYYVTSRGRVLIRATVDFTGDARVSRRDTIVNGGFQLSYQDGNGSYDVAADGRLLLVRRETPGRFPVVLTDWHRLATAARDRAASK